MFHHLENGVYYSIQVSLDLGVDSDLNALVLLPFDSRDYHLMVQPDIGEELTMDDGNGFGVDSDLNALYLLPFDNRDYHLKV